MRLTIETSARIKAIAVILLVMTHVFNLFFIGSSNYVIPLFNTGYSLETVLGRAADICVYLFAFISGYGLFHSYVGKNYKSIFFSTLTRIIKFLLCYWLVIFVIFLPFYVVNQGGNFQFIELIKTMFGHHGFQGNWYIYFYLLLLITLPFVSKLLNINKQMVIYCC